MNKDIQNFIKTCSINAGESTLKKIRGRLKVIEEFYDGNFDNLKFKELESFLIWLNEKEYAPNTYNDTIKILKRFLEWKYEKDFETRFKKFKIVKIRKTQQTKQELLTPEELEKLLRGSKTIKHTAMINLAWESGCRPNELLRLKWKDFDYDKKEIKLFSSKNNTTRIIPLDKSIHSLNDWKQKYSFNELKKEDFIFPNPNDRNKILTIQSFSQYVSKLGEKILDKKLSPYTLRHTRCNIWFNSGMNPKDYELVADHTHAVAMTYYQQSDKERLNKKFKEIYGIKKLTSEDKDLIKELESLKEELNKKVKQMDKITKQSKSYMLHTKLKLDTLGNYYSILIDMLSEGKSEDEKKKFQELKKDYEKILGN